MLCQLSPESDTVCAEEGKVALKTNIIAKFAVNLQHKRKQF